MIELKTGEISFPDLKVTMGPLATMDSFQKCFPADRYHKIQDTASGCSWYGAKERLYDEDSEIPIWLCFNQHDQLESVELYPQFGDEECMEGFPMDAVDSEQKYCAAWLQRYCGLAWENTGFPWGTIHNDYDARSDSCGIVIRYNREIA